MPPQLPHPCMPPVAAMLLLCTAHLPVTCPVPPTACHMPCDPIPGSFFNAWRWAHNLCDPNFYPPTEASTAASTDCLYLCDACTLRAMHIILHRFKRDYHRRGYAWSRHIEPTNVFHHSCPNHPLHRVIPKIDFNHQIKKPDLCLIYLGCVSPLS